MNTDELKNIFYNSKSKSEFINKLKIDTKHKSGRAIDDYIYSLVSDFVSTRNEISAKAFKERYTCLLEKEYNKNKKICIKCGSKIDYKRSLISNFCCEFCARSFSSSKRTQTEETKQKISEKLKENKHNKKYKKCICCGKIFEVKRLNSGRLSASNVCSDECKHKIISEKAKLTVKRRIDNGTFIGWQSRNIVSYPEKFWQKVLQNEKIDYKFNYKFGKFFLDFFIVKNEIQIDLEIDGKQHKYIDRQISDKERDIFVKSQNVIVYRIDWNEINTEKGKSLMKEKIDNFLYFYKSL